MEKITAWLKKNWLLILILVIGAFLRLYRIGDYMTFLGDEGRDVIIVRRLLVNFDPILIGPGTSIGNMYLGPLYYYMIAPALLLANFSPVGPAIFVALLGIATIYFVYRVAKEWFTPRAGLIAALLYAVSPTVIIHSHSSWNPNIMPFFSLLSVYSVWKVWKEKNYKWLAVLGVSYAVVLQSHYLGILLLPAIIIFLFLSRPPTRYILIVISLFALLMSPLVLFDLRHNFMNLKALKVFLMYSNGSFSFNFITNLWPTFKLVITRLLAGGNDVVGTILAVIVILSVLKYKPKFTWVFMAFGILGLSLYKYEIYDHYFGFLFPVVFILIGGLLEHVNQKALFLIVGFLVFVNLQNSSLWLSPNRQLERAQEVAEKIKQESEGKKFNLAVIADRNYEDGYQYFLEKDGLLILEIDAQVSESVANQLFVVCEMEKSKCDPTHSAKAEVANFGWSKIEAEWELMGVTIYKLVHVK